MTKKTVRIIQINKEYSIRTNRSLSSFKSEFPEAKYNSKKKIYTLPKPIFKSQLAKPIRTKREAPPQQILTQRKKRKPKQFEAEPISEIPEKRIRKAVALDMKTKDNTDSIPNVINYCSIKAITINPDITEKGLKLVIEEVLKEYEAIGYNFDFLTYRNYGIEETQLSDDEELQLNDMKIHFNVIMNGKTLKHHPI